MKRQPFVLVLLSTIPVVGCTIGASSENDLPAEEANVGQSEEEIIGGQTASYGQFPWQALITLDGKQSCGGSLIHPSWVLTAAHCVTGVATNRLAVFLGDHRTNAGDAAEISRGVGQVFVHPNYAYLGNAPYNDVALIRLASPAPINAKIQTIQLQNTTASATNHTVSGWGWTSAYGSGSTTLRYAAIPVVPNSSCDAAPLTRDLVAQELCAGFVNGSKGGCHGDSGGPLFTQSTTPAQQVGVVSWGRGTTCDTFTVFARVSSFVPWIQSVVNAPLRRSVRMSWAGVAVINGNIRLSCSTTGETVIGPTNVGGVEISLDCPGGTVSAQCSANDLDRKISGFSRRKNGVTTNPGFYTTSAADSVAVASGDTIEYSCSFAEQNYCGNGVCAIGEDDTNCAFDCGWCGDNVCGYAENAMNCNMDCGYCGDGVCCDETSWTCPQDCSSANVIPLECAAY